MEHGTTMITGRMVDDHTGIVDVQGDMNAGCEDALMAAYAEACGAATKGVVLNFDKLEFLNSGGIGLLVTLLVRANRSGQRISACGPVRALPGDLRAHPPRRRHRDPSH